MDKVKVLRSLEEVKALSDPYRFKILNCFYEMKKPATVKQIADKLGEVPANIHYHVKKLEKFDIVRLHHTEEIRGIVAKYYKCWHIFKFCSSVQLLYIGTLNPYNVFTNTNLLNG